MNLPAPPMIPPEDVRNLLAPFKAIVDTMMNRVQAIEVTDSESNQLAVNTILELKEIWTAIEGIRKELVLAPNKYVSFINRLCKDFQDPLKNGENSLRAKANDYANAIGQEKTRTEDGTSYQRQDWTFEIVNLADVPREWLVLNETAVMAAIRAGLRQIQGLRIYANTKTVVRRS